MKKPSLEAPGPLNLTNWVVRKPLEAGGFRRKWIKRIKVKNACTGQSAHAGQLPV